MKPVIILLYSMLLLGCEKKYEKEDFLGTWETVSETGSQTGEVNLIEGEHIYIVDIRPDSLYTNNNATYSWQMKGDSVFVNEWPFYIKELSDNKIIIEAEYFYEDGKYLVEFKRINKASIVEY